MKNNNTNIDKKTLRENEFMLLDDRHLIYNLNRCKINKYIKKHLSENSVYEFKKFLQKKGLYLQNKLCN